jgi:predicted nucleotidyltransferase
MQMTAATDHAFPTYAALRARRVAERRAAAVKALRAAEVAVRERGGRLVVFGSLAEGRFGEQSDLDVAILGVPAGPDSELAAEIDTMLTTAGFVADVLPERFMAPSLRAKVLNHGREPSTLG